VSEEKGRDLEAEVCLDDKENEKWQLIITRVQNGYIIESSSQPPYVIQESENDELKEHEELLYRVMEYFDFQGSKHDLERLRVVREKYRRNKK
jgi:hypothetical protein